MKAHNLQRMQARNREHISALHMDISLIKALKRDADECGDLEAEHFHHNNLQYFKKRMAAYVEDQKAIKALLKEIK